MLDKRSILSDIVSLLVHCSDDDTFLITQDKSLEIWIPSVRVNDKSWGNAAKQLLDELKVSGKIRRICQLIRVWKPPIDMLNHVVFLVKVSKDQKQFQGSFGFKMFWASVKDLNGSYTFLKSPEILDFVSVALGYSVNHPQQVPESIAIPNISFWTTIIDKEPLDECVEILEDQVLLREETIHKRTMDCVNYTEEKQTLIYYFYLTNCFPSTYMNSRIFVSIFEKLLWDRNSATRLFNTADVESRGFLSYRDFLYIIAITDPDMKHGVIGTEIRSRYIFNHYDADKSGSLDFNKVKAIYQDIRNSKVKMEDVSSLAKNLEVCAKALGVEHRHPIDSDRFVKTLSTPRAKGTTILLRSIRSLATLLPKLEEKKNVNLGPNAVASKTAPSQLMSFFPGSKDSLEYSVAVHFIKLRKSGAVVEKVWDNERVLSETSLTAAKTGLKNSLSLHSFNHNDVHFEVLRGLEYFEREITPKDVHIKPGKRVKPPFNWGLVDPTGFAKCVMRVSDAVTQIFKDEPRLLELSSPTYVLGDLHGNFADLLRFEKALWPLGATLSSATLLLLGDYVDRGPHSVELIAHLFACKVQSPKKMILLRGNHEIRAVQKMFTFYQECCHKFGQKLGNDVWEAVNKAMDCLPLAAIIDNKVFCVHGGIPPPWLCPTVATINTIPVQLPRPDESSPLAWDIMWNDPLGTDKNSVNMTLELSANEGFALNDHRGTGHYFSSEALNNFLKTNRLSILLRAHQMHERGFYVQMSHKMETVFSCSNYGTAKNESACILVDNGRLRSFRVEVTS